MPDALLSPFRRGCGIPFAMKPSSIGRVLGKLHSEAHGHAFLITSAAAGAFLAATAVSYGLMALGSGIGRLAYRLAM
jgi:hypothetical protein